jgi:hypothetical protein
VSKGAVTVSGRASVQLATASAMTETLHRSIVLIGAVMRFERKRVLSLHTFNTNKGYLPDVFAKDEVERDAAVLK